MKLTPNENVLRVALIVFSIIFGLLSISLIALGVVYIDELWWPRRYVDLDFLQLPTLLIILGTLSFIMAIAGCFCAKSNNRRLLLIYGTFLLIILCLELTIAVIAFDNFDSGKKTEKLLETEYNSVDENDKIHFLEIEKHYFCCGLTGLEANCNSTIPPSGGCVKIIDNKIKTIALQTGYFTTILSILQVMKIAYVYLIQHLRQ